MLRRRGVFRRPATAADRVPRSRLRLGGGSQVLGDSVRVARTANGTRFLLFMSRGSFRYPGSERTPHLRARREARDDRGR